MGVVIANSMSLGTLNAGRLRPKKPGEIESPNQLTTEQAEQIAQANNITAEQAASLDGPELIQAIAAAGLSAPNQISAEQAEQLQAARELDAIGAPSIAAPNTINSIPDDTAPPYPFNHARILYSNIAKSSEVSQLDQNGNQIGAGTSKNVLQENTYERWSITSDNNRAIQFLFNEDVEFDCLCVGAHNLGSSGASEVRVLTSNSDSGGVFIEVASYAVTNDKAIMILLSSAISARRVRVSFSGGASRVVGVISIGKALQMQRPIFGGHNPITMSRQTTYQSRRSESGNFVSRNIIRQGLSGQYEWSNLTDDWVREYLDPFIISARKMPFFIAWRPSDYPDEVAYAWTTGDISPSNIGTRNLMSAGMEVQAYGD